MKPREPSVVHFPPPQTDINARLTPKGDAIIFTYTLDAPGVGGGAIRVELVFTFEQGRAIAQALERLYTRSAIVIAPAGTLPKGGAS